MRNQAIGARLLLALLLALSLTAAACGGGNADDGDAAATEEAASEDAADGEESEPGEVSAGGTTVAVTAHEYKFDVPETLPAGEVTFQLVNAGEEPHMFGLALLSEDAPPVAKLLKLPRKEQEKYLENDEVGYLDAKPGKVSKKSFTAELESGRRYGYVCFFESKGKPHVAFGMFGEFTVE